MWVWWSGFVPMLPWPPELSARDGITAASGTDPERTYRELINGANPGFMGWLLQRASPTELWPHHHAFLQYLHDALVIHNREHHPAQLAIADADAERQSRQSDAEVEVEEVDYEVVSHTVGG
jgi:hypothetical protein